MGGDMNPVDPSEISFTVGVLFLSLFFLLAITDTLQTNEAGLFFLAIIVTALILIPFGFWVFGVSELVWPGVVGLVMLVGALGFLWLGSIA